MAGCENFVWILASVIVLVIIAFRWDRMCGGGGRRGRGRTEHFYERRLYAAQDGAQVERADHQAPCPPRNAARPHSHEMPLRALSVG